MIRIKRGLDLPISGGPSQDQIEPGPQVRTVAVSGYDYPGLKPTMEVAVGDSVKVGQLLFTDKKTPGIKFTSPASGKVAAINRGAKRVFQSLVIDLEGDDELTFESHSQDALTSLSRERVVEQLIESSEWTAIRTRPFARVPAPDSSPNSIFVTAMDSRPLAPNPTLFINEQVESFKAGQDVLSRLTEGKVYVCHEDGVEVPKGTASNIETAAFSGPHPSGLAGTHIHHLDPVSMSKTVWVVGYQSVIAIGHLFLTGKLFLDRVISIAGPSVDNPRVVKTRLGASTDELTVGGLDVEGENRVVSGSVLDGRTAAGATAFLGRLHNQVSVLKEGTQRELLEFVMPGTDKFSLTRLYLGAFAMGKRFNMTTYRGSERSQIPLGTMESVMPLDILPFQLTRALLVGDLDSAIELGCLELDEDDIALCTFACSGKYEYGPYLRQMLTRIEEEG